MQNNDAVAGTPNQGISGYDLINNSIGFGEFNYAYSISLVSKFIYIENAKSACTTIKSSLGAAELLRTGLGKGFAERFLNNVHTNILGTPFVKPFQMGRHYFDDVLLNPRYTIFTFVKNPYTRILSAYLDKVVRKLPESLSLYETLGKTPLEDMSFLEFLKAIQIQIDARHVVDKHFRSQSLQCGNGQFRLDFVGKVEQFESDFKAITQKIGYSDAQIILGVSHSTKAKTVLSEYYGENEIAVVKSIFKDDFDMFDYNTNPPF